MVARSSRSTLFQTSWYLAGICLLTVPAFPSATYLTSAHHVSAIFLAGVIHWVGVWVVSGNSQPDECGDTAPYILKYVGVCAPSDIPVAIGADNSSCSDYNFTHPVISVTAALANTSQSNVTEVLTHEFGHALGLANGQATYSCSMSSDIMGISAPLTTCVAVSQVAAALVW